MNRSMEAIIAAYVLSLVAASGALMYSLLKVGKPKWKTESRRGSSSE